MGKTRFTLANRSARFVVPFFFLVCLSADKDALSQNFWQQTNGPNGADLRALAINSSGHIFAASYGGGIFRSMNNGDNWTAVNSGLTNMDVRVLDINSSGHIFAGTGGGGIFRSMDNGTSWTAPNSGLSNLNISAFAINSSGNIFAGTNGGGIFRSMDNGENWAAINSGLGSFPRVGALAINSSGDIFAGIGSGVYRSRDNGVSWTNVSGGNVFFGTVVALAINASGHIFAGGDGGVNRSTNNGNSWTAVNSSLPRTDIVALAINSSGHIFWGGSGRGIYRSTTNGDSWTAVNTGLTDLGVGALAINSSGHIFAGTFGGVVFRSVKSTVGVAPSVTTNTATNVSLTSATLNGTVNPNELSTAVKFEYGTTTIYGTNVTAIPSPVIGTSSVSVSVALAGLSPNTLYHYRVVGTNSAGTTTGVDQNFTTTSSGSPPTVTTNVATNVSSTSATLNGTVNPNSLSTTVIFQYGTTTSYGNEINATPNPVSGTNAVSVSAVLTGLPPNTLYHYRAIATNNAGTTNGANQMFTTAPNRLPVVADTIRNQMLTVGGPSFTRNLNASPTVFSDPDGDALSYTASSSLQNNATANISGSTLTVSPVNGGVSTITVTANDGRGGMVSTMFTVTINRPPVLANPIANQTLIIGGASFTRDLNASPMVFSEPDGDALTYSANSNAPAIATASVSGSQLTVTPVAVGSATITVTANDSKGGTVSTMFNVTVSGLAPTVTTNPATNITSTSATLNGKVNPNGLSTIVKFQYGTTTSYGSEVTATQSPASGAIEISISAQLTGLSPNTQYNYRVIGMNSAGNTNGTNQTFTTVNRPPVVADTLRNRTLTVGGPSFVRDLNASPAVFSDSDGDVLSYIASSSLPNNATVNISGSTLTVSPVSGGVSTITVTANDGKSGMVSTMFTVTINRPPVLATPIANQTLTVGGASFTRDLNISPAVFSDPDGDALAYSANSSAMNIATTRISGTMLTVAPVAIGDATITVTANDGRGGVRSTTFTATVNLPAYPSSLNLNTTVTYPSRPNASNYPATDYRIVGLPGASNRLVNEFLSGTQNQDWQVFRDNGAASNFFVAFDGSANFQFSVGRAFWIINKGTLSISTTVPSVPLNTAQEIELPQPNSGWNLITNPFTASVAWSKIQSANNVTEPIYAFNGSFSTATSFDPYSGYYFFNATNLTKLKIPYSLYFSSTPAANADPAIWRVNILFSSGEINDKSTSFGIASEASPDLDRFDFRKPRALAATPTVEFKRPTWDAKYSLFATDIRPEFEDAESWEFDVRAISREAAQLTFAGISKIPRQFEVYLIDADHAQSVNLREDSLYHFTPAAELMKFKVVVGRKEKVQEQLSSLALPKAFALGPNYPNPFNPTTTIPVAVPVASEIKLKIYNLLGAEVKTIYDGGIEAGRYWFTWDGRNALGENVATGVYLYRLSTRTRISLLGKTVLIR